MNDLQVGCAVQELDVPLFIELCGYGVHPPRRNRGIHDPITCRAISFYDGVNRLILITSDICLTDSGAAEEVKKNICLNTEIDLTNIMITSTHTHSAPGIIPDSQIGKTDYDFREKWIKSAINVAKEACRDETPVSVYCGKAELSECIAMNRVYPNKTVPAQISWLKFQNKDNSIKLLLHSYPMHAVVFGAKMLQASADWPGAVNQAVLSGKIAENVHFLQGTCGNINPESCCEDLNKGGQIINKICDIYIADLKKSLNKGNKISLVPLKAIVKNVLLPSENMTIAKVRKTASEIENKYGRSPLVNQMEETAIFMKYNGGKSKQIYADLQVFKLGNFFLYGMPGEPFWEIGQELEEKSPVEFTIVTEHANANIRYIPTEKVYEEFSDPLGDKRGYGFYETQMAGWCIFKTPYKKDISKYMIKNYLDLTNKLENC
jgi:hypothetical protein